MTWDPRLAWPWSGLVDCCGARRGLPFWRIAGCRRAWARACARTTSFPFILLSMSYPSSSSYPRSSSSNFFPCPPILPDPPILAVLSLPYAFQGLPQAGSRAGPGPRCGGLIRDHAGGTLRGRPPGPQRLDRALPRPGPHAPNLRRATDLRGAGGWKTAYWRWPTLIRNRSDGVEPWPFKRESL